MSEPRDSERPAALLQAMLGSSLDAVVTIDADGRILMFNHAAEATFGYREDDVLGEDVAELIIPPSLRERHREAMARFLGTGERTILNRRVEVTGMRSDGSEFPIELTVTSVPLEGPPVFTAYLRDITDRQRAEQELLESRARIVESADRERKRIERNLHDGAQQRLVAILLLLRNLTRDGAIPPSQREVLDLATDETGRAIEELRELVRGIHPVALTESGLASALRGLAGRSPVDVEVDVPEQRLPEPIEVAFYYVAAESLANIAKYARATSASLSLEAGDDVVVLRVSDDGVGGADTAGGSGFAGLADRMEALDGTLDVHSPVGGGTTVTATVPRR
jgi:PAS domain S-box-containing protein